MFDGSMSKCFHTLSYPTQFLGKKYKHKTSILVHIGENDPNPNPEKRGANTVGVIGGASIDSTLYFLQKLAHLGSKEGKECPPFLVCSDPQLKEDLLMYERINYPCHFDDKPIVEKLKQKMEYLERGGARCLVIPCHLLHLWHNDVCKGCSIPVLHMGECVAKELKEAKLKAVETGSPLRIGLVATDAVLRAGFYQHKLQDEGFEVVVPDKATTEHILLPAMEALNRKDIEGARNLFRILVQLLLVRAVNVVIIASRDFRNLLPQDDPLLKKCIDPVDALVKSTIRWAHSIEERSS